MRANRSQDTRPELAVRRLLHAAGMRYRVGTAPIPGLRRRADIVFRKERIAIFIDGCFWHGCPLHGRRHFNVNADYWSAKIEANRMRDLDTTQRLSESGWLVLRYWEHADPAVIAAEVTKEVRSRRDNP